METSPLKSASEELLYLRTRFHESVEVFSTRIESEIMRIHECVLSEEKKSKRPPRKVLADARDMLALLRSLDVKPAKGRRRDFKRYELAMEDLRQLVESW